jgi:hypothetical protein
VSRGASTLLAGYIANEAGTALTAAAAAAVWAASFASTLWDALAGRMSGVWLAAHLTRAAAAAVTRLRTGSVGAH